MPRSAAVAAERPVAGFVYGQRMTWFDIAEVVGGALIILATLYDLFDSVVLPRPSVGRLSPSLALLRGMWWAWRWLGTRSSQPNRREAILAVYAPLAVLVLLAVRMVALVVGYALVFDGLRHQFNPAPQDFGISLFFSTASLLSLG
ncbi:MAG TPA: hypothetical protein VGP96_11160, partial [Candidatus Dormibacteraeota bacterium]|nr:hypothetical protein [Candidatus Dormibacteraeota bacterium]